MDVKEIKELWKISSSRVHLNMTLWEAFMNGWNGAEAKKEIKLHHRDIIQNLLIEIQRLEDKIEYGCECHEFPSVDEEDAL